MTHPSIQYEFEHRPEIGESIEIFPGIRWLRMPLPFMLGHINLWLLEDDDHWTIVDTGIYTPATRDHWESVLSEQLAGKPVNRVLVTHLHPDHVGCAGWLCERFDAPLWMSREEYLLCRVLVADTGKEVPIEAIRFYAAAGFPETALERYEKTFGRFGSLVAPMPQSYHRLFDGMKFRIGENLWRVIVGQGHSVEHACLFCEQLNVLISGDQILPTISSNVSVYPTEPNANPLDDWLSTLRMLADVLPADVLVLPAHGKPFRGAAIRLNELIAEHLDGLEKLKALCSEPIRAIDAFPVLFKSVINDNNLIMATGESIAHLHYLLELGEITSRTDQAGTRWYELAK
ncbi:MAG: MBL fold metallo-hydrolase [Xanthomonadales bacterium]|nr:MBL fold metallo-hydrolase [Xanthomonadales bacterium]